MRPCELFLFVCDRTGSGDIRLHVWKPPPSLVMCWRSSGITNHDLNYVLPDACPVKSGRSALLLWRRSGPISATGPTTWILLGSAAGTATNRRVPSGRCQGIRIMKARSLRPHVVDEPDDALALETRRSGKQQWGGSTCSGAGGCSVSADNAVGRYRNACGTPLIRFHKNQRSTPALNLRNREQDVLGVPGRFGAQRGGRGTWWRGDPRMPDRAR